MLFCYNESYFPWLICLKPYGLPAVLLLSLNHLLHIQNVFTLQQRPSLQPWACWSWLQQLCWSQVFHVFHAPMAHSAWHSLAAPSGTWRFTHLMCLLQANKTITMSRCKRNSHNLFEASNQPPWWTLIASHKFFESTLWTTFISTRETLSRSRGRRAGEAHSHSGGAAVTTRLRWNGCPHSHQDYDKIGRARAGRGKAWRKAGARRWARGRACAPPLVFPDAQWRSVQPRCEGRGATVSDGTDPRPDRSRTAGLRVTAGEGADDSATSAGRREAGPTVPLRAGAVPSRPAAAAGVNSAPPGWDGEAARQSRDSGPGVRNHRNC